MPQLRLINPPGSEAMYENFRFSQAVVTDDRVDVAGQVGMNADFSVPEDVTEQARLAYQNLRNVLEAAGSSLQRVSALTLYFTDPGDMAALEKVFAEFFPKNYPARTVVRVAGLVLPNLKLEVQAVAVLNDDVSF